MFRLVETDGSGNVFRFNVLCGKMIRKSEIDDDKEEMCEWMMIRKSEIEK